MKKFIHPKILIPIGVVIFVIGYLLYNKHPQLGSILGAIVGGIAILTAIVFFGAMIWQNVFRRKK